MSRIHLRSNTGVLCLALAVAAYPEALVVGVLQGPVTGDTPKVWTVPRHLRFSIRGGASHSAALVTRAATPASYWFAAPADSRPLRCQNCARGRRTPA